MKCWCALSTFLLSGAVIISLAQQFDIQQRPTPPQQPGKLLSSGWKTIHVYIGNETLEQSSEFFSPRSQPKSHSQVGQDQTVALLFSGKPGFFIDLAANDAVALSNTLMLERDYGWDGICVEANPGYWSRLARRRCTVVGAAVGHVDNEIVEFNAGVTQPGLKIPGQDIGVFGGIVGFDNKVRQVKKETTWSVHTAALLNVLEKTHAPPEIDYFSFDVEGAELFIAKAFPWHKYTVKLMTVEKPSKALKIVLKEKAHMVYLQTLQSPRGKFYDELWCHKTYEAEFQKKLQGWNWLPYDPDQKETYAV
jgi:hypothetical protein